MSTRKPYSQMLHINYKKTKHILSELSQMHTEEINNLEEELKNYQLNQVELIRIVFLLIQDDPEDKKRAEILLTKLDDLTGMFRTYKAMERRKNRIEEEEESDGEEGEGSGSKE